MQMRKVVPRVIILIFTCLSIWGIMLANEAMADKPPLKVSLTLPSNVTAGQVFNIQINVTNQTASSIQINKVAVGYALQSLKVRGPYEVNFTPVNVPGNGAQSFVVPFRILGFNEPGTVVGLTVILARNYYGEYNGSTLAGLMGSAAGGVRVD